MARWYWVNCDLRPPSSDFCPPCLRLRFLLSNPALGLFCLLVRSDRVNLVGMKLRLVVEHDPDTKRWAAFFPELPGCASAGDTEEEAIHNAREALELWFEPTPVTLPAGAKVLEVALT